MLSCYCPPGHSNVIFCIKNSILRPAEKLATLSLLCVTLMGINNFLGPVMHYSWYHTCLLVQYVHHILARTLP